MGYALPVTKDMHGDHRVNPWGKRRIDTYLEPEPVKRKGYKPRRKHSGTQAAKDCRAWYERNRERILEQKRLKRLGMNPACRACGK